MVVVVVLVFDWVRGGLFGVCERCQSEKEFNEMFISCF